MNSSSSKNSRESTANYEAANWVLRNDRGLSAPEQDDFNDWLSISKDHREAYAKHRWGWEEIDRLAGLQSSENLPINPDLLVNWKPKLAWLENKLNQLKFMAALGVMILAIGLGYFFLGSKSTIDESLTVEDSISVERIQTIELEDGSFVELNHGAEIRVEYSENERLVRLLNGEANFDIEEDVNRPFVVSVSDMRFRALGTIFNLRYDATVIDLIVTEGRVEVAQAGPEEKSIYESEKAAVVESSQMAIVPIGTGTAEIEILSLKDEHINEKLKWIPEVIDFNQQNLVTIISEFNRRNRVQMTTSDEALSELKLTSVFWSDNVEGFVRLLESNFNVNARWSGEYEIELTLAN